MWGPFLEDLAKTLTPARDETADSVPADHCPSGVECGGSKCGLSLQPNLEATTSLGLNLVPGLY